MKPLALAPLSTDLPAEEELKLRAVRMYIALTRAQVAVRIVGGKAEFERDPVLGALHRG